MARRPGQATRAWWAWFGAWGLGLAVAAGSTVALAGPPPYIGLPGSPPIEVEEPRPDRGEDRDPGSGPRHLGVGLGLTLTRAGFTGSARDGYDVTGPGPGLVAGLRIPWVRVTLLGGISWLRAAVPDQRQDIIHTETDSRAYTIQARVHLTEGPLVSPYLAAGLWWFELDTEISMRSPSVAQTTEGRVGSTRTSGRGPTMALGLTIRPWTFDLAGTRLRLLVDLELARAFVRWTEVYCLDQELRATLEQASGRAPSGCLYGDGRDPFSGSDAVSLTGGVTLWY